MDLPGPLELLVTKDLLVHLDLLDRWALQDRRDQGENLVFLVFLVLMDYPETMVILEKQELKETKDQKDTRVPWGFPALVE